MVEQLNTIGRLWWEWSAAMFWQVGLLILVIATIDRLTRRWTWPQLRYALWSLILIKLLLPPSLALPSGVVPSLTPVVRQALARLQSEKPVAAETHTTLLLNEDLSGGPAANPWASTPFVVSGGRAELAHDMPVRASEETPYGVTTSESAGGNPVTPFSRFTWQVYAMMASLGGTLILGIWLFVRLHSLVGRRAQETAAASLPQSFYNQLAVCARRLELSFIPRVVVTRSLATPAVFGVFRPVLLMPKGYLSKLSRRDTEHMLLHELAHVKRGDLVAHGLYMLLQVVYWYNPLLWLVRRQVHHLRELSCDATVAELLREQTMAYRQTLLETARRLLTSSVEPGLGLLGLFEDSNRLLVRLDWLTKPTWRYRTMKRVTVTTIAALMLACVLPMARAQQAASNESSPEVVKQEDPSAQQIAALQARLEELMAQQKQLQDQLQALTQQRGQTRDKVDGGRAGSYAVARRGAKERTEAGNVTVVPWQDANLTDQDVRQLKDAQEARRVAEERGRAAMDEESRARLEAQRAQLEAQRAKVEARRADIDKQRVKAEAKRREGLAKRSEKMGDQTREWTQGDQMRQWTQGEQMQQWAASFDEWENSEEMKQWQEKMEQWSREMEKWGEEMGRRYEQGGDEVPSDGSGIPQVDSRPAMPVMPAMPKMPPMPQTPPVSVNVQVPEVVVTPAPVPQIEMAPAVPQRPLAEPKREPEQAVLCGDLLVKSLPAAATLQVENGVGDVVVDAGEGRDCTVKATAKIRGVDREEAERIAKEIVVQVTPADGCVRVAVQLPKDMNDEQKSKISVDVKIAAPADVKLQANVKVGNLRLSSIQGKVTAAVDVGAIETWNLQGDVALRTNVGNIKFVASDDLAAMIQAQTQVGSISSDLPLEITGAAVMRAGNAQNALGSHASGTLGDGKNKIDLRVNVGSIQIQRKSPPQEREVF